MHKKFSRVFSVGPKTPVTPGTSLSQWYSASILDVFINIHEYANEINFI